MPVAAYSTLFPHTKLYSPVVGEDVLARPALLARLQQAVTTKALTLISAQAGAGKTTLIARLQQVDPAFPIAWLSLDESDNDVERFLLALLATVQQQFPDCAFTAQSLLTSSTVDAQATRAVISLLINELLQYRPTDFGVALDDLHLITNPAIFQALDYLLEHLPPFLHIVIATREDPPLALSRFRVRNQLAEIRIEDLRFDQAEMAALLSSSLDLNLAEAELVQLWERTEGWVAGIHLLALSLVEMDAAMHRTFIERFAQSHTFIFDYLVDEVLNQQEPSVRRFLLETSILRELTPTACAAVTGQEHCAQMLEQLYRRNLFLTRRKFEHQLVEQSHAVAQPSYRYHDLFAQFLSQQLRQSTDQTQIHELHRRAAAAATDQATAIHHYLAGGWWENAATAIEAIGKHQLETIYVHQYVAGWIQQLPTSILNTYPWLQLLLGYYLLNLGQRQEAKAYFVAARSQFVQMEETLGEGIVLFGLYSYQEFDSSTDQQRLEGLAQLHSDHPFFVIAKISEQMGGAWIAMHTQRWHLVPDHVRAGMRLALQQNNIPAIRQVVRNFGLQFHFGDLERHELEQFIQHVNTRHGEHDALIHMGVTLHYAILSFLAGHYPEAEQRALQASAQLDQLGGDIVLYFGIDQVVLFKRLAEEDVAGVQAYLTAIQPRVDTIESYRNSHAYPYFRTRLAWVADEQAEAMAQSALLEAGLAEVALTGAKEREVSALEAKGLSAWCNGDTATAETHFQAAATLQKTTRHTLFCTDNRLNLAMLYLELGRTQDALTWLTPALQQWAQKRMPGVVLQSGLRVIPVLRFAIQQRVSVSFAQQLLEQFQAATETEPVLIAATNETLTVREVEVLRLIVRGASNREIADELVVSLNTVKSHVTRILAKLAVSSRTQAASRARELKIL